MSCELHRQKFFEIVSASGSISAEELERVYQGHRHSPTDAERLSVEAKTRSLFSLFTAQGLKPPTHSADGLPKSESQPGYAAVFDVLRRKNLLGDNTAALKKAGRHVQAIFSPTDPALGLDGRDEQGYDRWGYNREGLDRNGFDRDGYDKNGMNRNGFNRQGFNRAGLDLGARNALGYDYTDVDKEGFSIRGYKDHRDDDGYDEYGFNANGYDREGYDCLGVHYDGTPDPNFLPDAQGYYPDGLNAYGFGRDGYDIDGYDRFGFGRDGYNRAGKDRNGYNRDLELHGNDAEGYNEYGYKQERRDGYYRSWNRAGYDNTGFQVSRTGSVQSHTSYTGFDRDGRDKDGQPRKVLSARGKLVNAKYDREGFDPQGFDQWGYHKDTGLTAPDKKGRQYNTDGWIYDKASDECFDPQDRTRRVKNQFVTEKVGRTKRKVVSSPYIPPAPPVPITPFANMTMADYDRVNGAPRDWDYDYKNYKGYAERIAPRQTVAQRRNPLSDTAVINGVKMRCPHCGQFTGGNLHQCPNFGAQSVMVYHSGIVTTGDRNFVLFAPHKPDFDPQYDNRDAGGYHQLTGLDRNGFDRNGYNDRGFDRDGYNRAGYDVFGYDRDGYDQKGYNNAGLNRRGEQRGRSLDDAQELARDEGLDLLANEDLARMYSQVATGLIGKPRRVVLKVGGGFATDMKGTIHADPYPLGMDADPRHNLVVTRAGIYHELGHEQFTPQEIWAQVLDVAQGRQDAGLGEAAKQMLPRFYNIVEDGRMERVVSSNYAGAAEILAASCRLEPRWGEEVGERVSESDQVFWSLLYTGLPYYRVRQEVRDGMTPNARKVFDELEPIMQRAVRGTPEEAYQAAVHIAKRFEEEGFIKLPPKDYSKQMPQPSPGQGQPQSGQGQPQPGQPQQGQSQPGQGQSQQGQPQSGQGQSGSASQEDEQGVGRREKKLEDPKKGRSASAGKKEDEPKGPKQPGASQEDEQGNGRQGEKREEEPASGRGSSAGKQEEEQQGQSGGDKPAGNGAGGGDKSAAGQNGQGSEAEEFLFGNEVVDAAVRSVERDAASAIENGARARSRATAIGKPLHNALPGNESWVSQRYRDGASGMPKTVSVGLPKGESWQATVLEGRRGRHKEIAALMAKPLRAIREQAEQRLRRQSEGRLDRRQLVNAYKGMDDVYASTKERPQTSFAASVSVDMSGSMHNAIHNNELYDAVMTLGDCFDMLDMPHEVRAFGSSTAQVKSMREKFDPGRASFLASGDLGGTQFRDTAGLAHSSLLACEEKNKIMVCMSDGQLNDHQESARVLKEARKNGVVTFGIYFGRGCDENKMNDLYGRGSWAAVEQLSDMPKVVAQRLASIFKSMR